MPDTTTTRSLLLPLFYLAIGLSWVFLNHFLSPLSSEPLFLPAFWEDVLLVFLSALAFALLLRYYHYQRTSTQNTNNGLLDQSHFPAWLVAKKSGKVLQMNTAAKALFEVSEEELSKLHMEELVDERDRYLVPKKLINHNANEYLGVWRFRSRKGEQLYLSVNLYSLNEEQTIVLANDVSSIKEAEEEQSNLHNELLLYKKALDRSAMLSVTNLQGDILDVNEKFCELSQYSREEVLGKSHHFLDTQLYSASYFRKMYSSLNKGEIWRDEFRNRAKDGRIFWVDMTIIPVYDSKNKLERYMAIAYPITSKKRAETQSEAIHQEFATFMYKTSHKLRGPVATLAGLSELARMEVKDPAASRYLQLLDERIRHLDFTLDEIIAITKIKQESLQINSIDFEALVQEVLQELNELISQHQIRIFQDIRPDISFSGDCRLLRSVLYYLCDNACRFRQNEQPAIWISIHPATLGVVLQVRDNGPGIEQSIRSRIYEMYYRGNEKSQGSGLGLYIVKSIVERLEGQLQLESSEDGGGSIFRVFLPQEHYRKQLEKEHEYLYLDYDIKQ